MALPASTARVLNSLGYEPIVDYLVKSDGGTVTVQWFSSDPQPTEQQINDWATDAVNLPNGQTFSQWLADHGGDSTLTLRRSAKEALDDTAEGRSALVRAALLVFMDEVNTLRAIHSLPARTGSQLRTAIANKLTAGDADT
jgi:hypothetical protein